MGSGLKFVFLIRAEYQSDINNPYVQLINTGTVMYDGILCCMMSVSVDVSAHTVHHVVSCVVTSMELNRIKLHSLQMSEGVF